MSETTKEWEFTTTLIFYADSEEEAIEQYYSDIESGNVTWLRDANSWDIRDTGRTEEI